MCSCEFNTESLLHIDSNWAVMKGVARSCLTTSHRHEAGKIKGDSGSTPAPQTQAGVLDSRRACVEACLSASVHTCRCVCVQVCLRAGVLACRLACVIACFRASVITRRRASLQAFLRTNTHAYFT
jgi:hypothetical protein